MWTPKNITQLFRFNWTQEALWLIYTADCKPKFEMATLYYVEIFTLHSQNQIQIPVVTPNYRNGIGIEIWICE